MMGRLNWKKVLGVVLLVSATILVLYEKNSRERRSLAEKDSATVRKNEQLGPNRVRSESDRKYSRKRVLEKDPDIDDMFPEFSLFKELEEKGEDIRIKLVSEEPVSYSQGLPRAKIESLTSEYFDEIEETFKISGRQAKNPVKVSNWINGRQLLFETWNAKPLALPELPYYGAEHNEYFVYCAKKHHEMDIGHVVYKSDGRVMSFDISQK